MMDQVRKEYGDDSLDGLVSPSRNNGSLEVGSLEVEEEYPSSFAPAKPKNSALFYFATLQAFIIIYRIEVLLGATLAISIGMLVSSSSKHHHKKGGAFDAARINHDYTAVTSKYDLDLGSIDHWCLNGSDNSCHCEDPLKPMSKRSSQKWSEQHTENTKVAQAALMKLLENNDAWAYDQYSEGLDDTWIDSVDDDWVDGEGARFGDDDFFYDRFAEDVDWGTDDYMDRDDGFGVPVEKPVDEERGEEPAAAKEEKKPATTKEVKKPPKGDRRQLGFQGLDVVFIGDSLTEQRQGTRMGKSVADYEGIKEVFDKTFTKSKGGEVNGIAMGIAGDTAPNLLWRLINGEMPFGLTPKVWWVGIGLNDLTIKQCSAEVVLLGILRVVEEIQNLHPNDMIVINSILPVQRNSDGLLEHLGKNKKDVELTKKEKNLQDNEMSNKRSHIDFWPSIVSINNELRKFATSHKKVRFYNADNIFVEERQGAKYMKLNLMHDPVHPNLNGQKKWHNAIKKKLAEFIKDME